MFSDLLCCENCERELPRLYPDFPALCEKCSVDPLEPLILSQISWDNESERKSFPPNIQKAIGAFCATSLKHQVYYTSTRHRARKYFLRCLLLAKHGFFKNPFKSLTYFSGGLAGSVSDYEDILDRILSFL